MLGAGGAGGAGGLCVGVLSSAERWDSERSRSSEGFTLLCPGVHVLEPLEFL